MTEVRSLGAPHTIVVVEGRACSHLLWRLRCSQGSESESDGIRRGFAIHPRALHSNTFMIYCMHELLWLRLLSHCSLGGVLLHPGSSNVRVPHLRELSVHSVRTDVWEERGRQGRRDGRAASSASCSGRSLGALRSSLRTSLTNSFLALVLGYKTRHPCRLDGWNKRNCKRGAIDCHFAGVNRSVFEGQCCPVVRDNVEAS